MTTFAEMPAWAHCLPPIAESVTPLSLSADVADIRACLDGDGEAYRRIVERHQDHVGAIMWRFTRDQNEHKEMVHDMFVEAFLGLAKFRGDAPLEHWLARVATRLGYKLWRRRAQDRQQVSLEEWQEIGERKSDLSPGEAGELVHRLLGMLSPRDRLVMTMRFVDERTVEETAALTGWSETMVKVQTWRARRKLKGLLARLEGS
ncbi:MAG: RNA polymerase sigma-70 factor (ECF subfamily) [Rhodothermales bacterium]